MTMLNLICVPACNQCNGIVGQILHRTIGDRRRFCQQRLKELKARKWQERIEWRNGESIDNVMLAANGLSCTVDGENIVLRFVASGPRGVETKNISEPLRPLWHAPIQLDFGFARLARRTLQHIEKWRRTK